MVASENTNYQCLIPDNLLFTKVIKTYEIVQQVLCDRETINSSMQNIYLCVS